MRKFSTRSIALASMTLAGLTLVSSNIYLAAGESNQINGCVNKKTQVLRIAEKCTGGETKISWSVQGPAGPAGPKGETGTAGASSPVSAIVPFHQVLDATGKVVGNLIGSTVYETVILIGKSKVAYSDATGAAVSMSDSAIYFKSDCTGTAYQYTDGFLNHFTIELPYIDGESSLGLGRERFAAINVSKPIKKYPSEMFFVSREDSNWACVKMNAGSKGEVETQVEIQELKIIEGIPMKVPVPFTIK
jgi:hypothetical protein